VAQVWNVAEKLLRLMQSASGYPLLLIHVETNDDTGETFSVS